MATELKAPRIRTVKRLFALSSNQCAYPDCTTAVVDSKSGVVLCEIAHIAAQSPGGPRYDVVQSAEERHGFENLILLCGTHHKEIDDNHPAYDVPALAKMKADHEALGMDRPSPEADPDVVADELLSKYWVSVSVDVLQTGDNASAVITTNISQGLTYSDARQLAVDLWKANALELRGIAEDVAAERAGAVAEEFLMRLYRESPDAAYSLADPDMQHALFEAQKSAARRGSTDLSKLLVDLLTQRAQETGPERELIRLVLNEAVEVTAKLTADQFDALTLVFLISATRYFGIVNSKDLHDYVDLFLAPFLDGASRTTARFQHLQYCGCGSIGLGSRELRKVLGMNYPTAVGVAVPSLKITKILGEESWTLLQRKLFREDPENAEHWQLLLWEPVIDQILQSLGVDTETTNKLKKLITTAGANRLAGSALYDIHPRLQELDTWWSETPARHFNLTSVGIAIAHGNLRRRGLTGFDLRIWLN